MEEQTQTTPMVPQEWYLGSDIKVQVLLEAQGFDMDLHDWAIAVYLNGKKVHTYPKSSCARDDQGNWFCCISAEHLKKSGVLVLAGLADVVDEDFDGGIRHEVDRVKIGTYKAI